MNAAQLTLRRSVPAKAESAAPSEPRQQWKVVHLLPALALWALLWAGYNTGPWYVESPYFPISWVDLIHGLRAFFPILGGWIAALIILMRTRHIAHWIMGPLGLVLVFTVAGLASSATMSPEPVEALYWGATYGAIVIVLVAICTFDDPLPHLSSLLTLNWMIAGLFTLGILGIVPHLGVTDAFEVQTGKSWVIKEIAGMPGTRNTGFARYAAMCALGALGNIGEGSRTVRLFWAGLLGIGLYCLVIANGRTEILAFIGGALLILGVRKKYRLFFVLVASALGILLGLKGFYQTLFHYLTRTGHVDATITGRTDTWRAGWALFLRSPWWGFGFQADRYMGVGHMHNAFLHVLVEGGILGGAAIYLALIIVWWLTIKHFFLRPPQKESLLPPEIPGVLMFLTLSSIPESTFAYFSAAWLLSAPALAYVVALDRKLAGEAKTKQANSTQVWLESLRRRRARGLSTGEPAIAPGPDGGSVTIH